MVDSLRSERTNINRMKGAVISMASDAAVKFAACNSEYVCETVIRFIIHFSKTQVPKIYCLFR